jgi:hypothetical protein
MEGCPRLHPATLHIYGYRFYEACKELMNLASKDSSSIPSVDSLALLASLYPDSAEVPWPGRVRPADPPTNTMVTGNPDSGFREKKVMIRKMNFRELEFDLVLFVYNNNPLFRLRNDIGIGF